MELIARVTDQSLTVFAIVLVAVMMLVREAGYRIGRRRRDGPDEGITLLTGGLLGLMSFVLAFNLSTATGRLEDRRLAGLEEAQAIGTAWLQARALGGPRGEAIATALEDYARSRRDYAMAAPGDPAIAAEAARTAALQAAIWAEVTALLAGRSDPQTVSLANAVSATFDSTLAQSFALESSLPWRLILLLVLSSLMSIGCLGYYLALYGKPHHALSLALAMIWSGVIALIVDLGVPRMGTINIDVRPYDRTIESFAQAPP